MTTWNTVIPDILIQRSQEIVFEQFGDELLAVDAQSGYCYAFNETAGRLWELISTPATLRDICTQLCQEYDIDPETCLREIGALVQELAQAGIVQADSETAH